VTWKDEEIGRSLVQETVPEFDLECLPETMKTSVMVSAYTLEIRTGYLLSTSQCTPAARNLTVLLLTIELNVNDNASYLTCYKRSFH
jgi:hypothetical protein